MKKSLGTLSKLSLIFIVLLPNFSSGQVTLSLRMIIEGYYYPTSNSLMNNSLYLNGVSLNQDDVDSVKISLMDSSHFFEVESHKTILSTNGVMLVNFANA